MDREVGCCGQHLFCEKIVMLREAGEPIIYYDDEELDVLAGIRAEDYTPEQCVAIEEVYDTLIESDVRGWVHSMQLRGIELPTKIHNEVVWRLTTQ